MHNFVFSAHPAKFYIILTLSVFVWLSIKLNLLMINIIF